MLYEDQAGRFDERAGVPADAEAGLLDALRDWAEAHYGDLKKKRTLVEFFELDSIFWGNT